MAKSITQFIQEQSITSHAVRTDHNPNTSPDDWSRDARHWNVFLSIEGRRMKVPFSQGAAHTQPPTAADVLDCLASDSASVENAQSFEDWCSEYGYDTDSRKAEKTYHVCEKQSERLKSFLGDEAYNELLWKTERQ